MLVGMKQHVQAICSVAFSAWQLQHCSWKVALLDRASLFLASDVTTSGRTGC